MRKNESRYKDLSEEQVKFFDAVVKDGRAGRTSDLPALLGFLTKTYPAEVWSKRKFTYCMTEARRRAGISVKPRGKNKRGLSTVQCITPIEEIIGEIFDGAKRRALNAIHTLSEDKDAEIKLLKEELEAKTKMLRDLKDVRAAVEKFKGFQS